MSQLKADRSLRVPFGPAGIMIPDLPEDATDDEIQAALAELDRARAELFARRKALAEDAAKSCALPSSGMTDEEADEKSGIIMKQLADAKHSITESTGIGEL